MTFTTRPELTGTFGMVATTHWTASAVGMRMLEIGGTAFDAAVAAGFTLNVVEPHLNGPLGEVPIMIWRQGLDPQVICGQGVAPAGATIAHYKTQGLDLIPGSGLLAAVVPGAFDAWMLLLRDHGRLTLREVMEPAIYYAGRGHPMLARAAQKISDQAAFFKQEWPTSAAVWLPNGVAPKAGSLFRNPDLAAFWTHLLDHAEGSEGREAQIDAARAAFSQGFVAELIDQYVRDAEVMDATGHRRAGVLTGQDMATWSAQYEAPVAAEVNDWTVWKCGPWSQGPSMLQSLKTLRNDDLGEISSGEDVHKVVEAMKLSFADRDAYYGDASGYDVPLETLLSDAYADQRRSQMSDNASLDHRSGDVGRNDLAEAHRRRAVRRVDGGGPGAGEPTMGHLNHEGDTVHIDVVDRWGNMVSATPSGGWLQSNPVIPDIGVPLGTRAQMFWLEDGLPTSLEPGRRPRTTLSPSLARRPNGTRLALGTPGGDQQDQWQLIFLLRLMHGATNLQSAIDAPLFHTGHLQSSFYPRGVEPGKLVIEPRFASATLTQLRDLGHQVVTTGPWDIGRLTGVSASEAVLLSAAATPRLMQAYAVGR